MSKGQSGLGIFALLSPLVGGWLASRWGWRGALATTGCVAAVGLALVALRLPETLKCPNRQALHPTHMAQQWMLILRHPAFRAWALLLLFTYGGLYTFLAASAFVYIDILGVTREQYGWLLASSSMAYLVGTFACRRALARWGIARSVVLAGVCTSVGGLSMIVLALWGPHSVWSICIPQLLFAFGHGIHQPCGQAGVVAPFPAQAGAASALSGFCLAAGAFFIGLWLGVAMDGTVLPMTLTQGTLALATAVTAWTGVRRHGDPSR
jgi:DHA1 family bicyclomycin/chloramphenicol resistance-like MFS transporter